MSALDNDDEYTPLLAAERKAVTPLPKKQLFLICFLRISEPVAFLVCFPFINQMLLDVGAAKDPKEVGWPAAVIESVFSVTQLLTVFHWGILSDKVGRKPVLILGCIGSAISAVGFGMSNSFWMMVFWRSINGIMNGNIAILKCVMTEISDETNEARAFSFFPLCLNIGTLLASYFGGEFANVAIKHPSISNMFPIFTTYPYLLPCALAAALPVLSAIAAFFFLEETLQPKEIDANGAVIEEEPIPIKELFTPKVNKVMFSFGILSLMGTAIGGLLPLFCFTPIADGGLEFSEKDIGNAMSIRAVAILVVQLLAFPWLQRKMGTYRLYKLMMFLWIPAFLGLPLLVPFAMHKQTMIVWLGLGFTLLCGAIGNMAFGRFYPASFSAIFRLTGLVCNLIMVNDAAPSRRTLGAINGIAQAVSSGVRVFGPGGASILFAVSVEHNVLGGQMVWLVCGLVAVAGVWSGLIIRQ